MAGKIHDEQLKVDIVINGNDAQKKLGSLQQAKRNLKKENDELRKAKAKLVAEGKKESEAFRRLSKQLKANNLAVKQNETKQKELRKELGLSGLNTKQLVKEQKRLEAIMSSFTPETTQWEKYNEQLQQVNNRLSIVRKKMKGVRDSMQNTKKSSGVFGKIKSSLMGLGPLIAATFSITAILSFFSTLHENLKVLNDLKNTLSKIANVQGVELNKLTSRVQALSKSFDKDFKKMSESANNLAKQMNISFSKALDVIEKGFYDGADANGELLDKIKEYPSILKEVGLNADESIALMTQEVKQGIYSDKGVDAIKEANLRLREMPKSTVEALESIGLSSKVIQKEITEGGKSIFDVIKQVSERMSVLPAKSKLVGQAIADIFGGPGEDAGYKYLANLHKIELKTTSLIDQSDDWTRAKKLEVEANEALNNVLVKLTGTGSSLSLLYNSFKLGLADLLSVLTGVKDTAQEAVDSFDKQAQSVINLDKNLAPLIKEYDNLKSKTSLTKEEQDRLKVIISKISGIVPTAITAFDDYGNALDISSEKAKEFIDTQKTLLRYKNAEVISEQKERLEELNKELERNKRILNKRNDQGDIVRVNQTFTKTDRIIVTEEKLSGREISKIQARQQEIQNLIKEHQIILDHHNGDYLEKTIEKQKSQTVKTKEQLEARKILEATATKYKIKNIESLSDQQLEVEISKAITRANVLAGIKQKEADAKAKAFKAGEEELNKIILNKRAERELNQKTGLAKEIARIESNYRALEKKYEDHKEKLAELEKLKQQEIDEAKLAKKQDYLEKAAQIEEQNRIAKEEALLEREINKAETDEEKAQLLLEKTRFIASEQLKIEEAAELAKVEAVEGSEKLKAAIREKYALKKAKVEATFQKGKTKLDKEATKRERELNKKRAQGYADMFGGIAVLLGKHTAAGKAAAIAQATINTYQGITEVWSSKSVLPEPFATASKVVSTATVLASGLASVRSINSTKVPGYEDGLYPVTRNDGKKFKAKLSKTRTGLVTEPTLMDGRYLAGERSSVRNPEMIIDDITFSKLDPRIPEYIMAVRNGTVAGFENGKYTIDQSRETVDFDSNKENESNEFNENSQIVELLNRIADATEKGSVLVIGYNEARKIKELQDELESSKQNGRIGS